MQKLSKTQKQMRETIRIDVGDKVSRYCIVDHSGEVVEEGSFRNQVRSLENISAGNRGASRWKPARNRLGSAGNSSGWGTKSSWLIHAS